MKKRLPKSSLKNSHRTSMSGSMFGNLLKASLTTLTGRIQWTWLFGIVGGLMLIAAMSVVSNSISLVIIITANSTSLVIITAFVSLLTIILTIYTYLRSSELKKAKRNQKNQNYGDTKFITFLKYVLPKEFQEEWLGDLREKRSQLIKSRALRWKVFLFTLIAGFGLIQSYLWFKLQKLISQLITRCNKFVWWYRPKSPQRKARKGIVVRSHLRK